MQQTKEHVLKVLFILIWVLALTHLAAEQFSLYWTYWWFDVLTHFLGGAWLGLASLWLWYFSGHFGTRMPTRRAVLIALFAGLSIGLLWEVYEYSVWQFLGTGLPNNYVADTLGDLAMDVVGALFGYGMFKIFTGRSVTDPTAV